MYFRILEDVQHAAQTYLLADLDEREAVLIDPSDSQAELVQALLFERDLRLRYVLQTHRHASSSDCGRGLSARTGAKLVIARRNCEKYRRRPLEIYLLAYDYMRK